MNSLTHLKHYCDILLLPWQPFQNKSSISENKESSFVLKSCYYWEKYSSKSKQHGLPDALSNNLSFRSLSVMIYQQFMVSIAELIMLSKQQLLFHNFQNTRMTWLFCRFSTLGVYIIHGFDNISSFRIWKLWLVICDVIFSETSLAFPKT